MKKETVKIITLGIQEVLESLADFTVLPFFSASNFYKVTQDKLLSNQSKRRSNLSRKIRDLKQRGYINTFVKGKKAFFEITPKGKAKIAKIKIKDVKISRPAKWDKKWRIIIFDIPEKYRFYRDAFRKILSNLGFIQIQKSVYVHPYECTDQIKFISEILSVSRFVKIALSEIIQGEEDIINEFIDNKILSLTDLQK